MHDKLLFLGNNLCEVEFFSDHVILSKLVAAKKENRYLFSLKGTIQDVLNYSSYLVFRVNEGIIVRDKLYSYFQGSMVFIGSLENGPESMLSINCDGLSVFNPTTQNYAQYDFKLTRRAESTFPELKHMNIMAFYSCYVCFESQANVGEPLISLFNLSSEKEIIVSTSLCQQINLFGFKSEGLMIVSGTWLILFDTKSNKIKKRWNICGIKNLVSSEKSLFILKRSGLYSEILVSNYKDDSLQSIYRKIGFIQDFIFQSNNLIAMQSSPNVREEIFQISLGLNEYELSSIRQTGIQTHYYYESITNTLVTGDHSILHYRAKNNIPGFSIWWLKNAQSDTTGMFNMTIAEILNMGIDVFEYCCPSESASDSLQKIQELHSHVENVDAHHCVLTDFKIPSDFQGDMDGLANVKNMTSEKILEYVRDKQKYVEKFIFPKLNTFILLRKGFTINRNSDDLEVSDTILGKTIVYGWTPEIGRLFELLERGIKLKALIHDIHKLYVNVSAKMVQQVVYQLYRKGIIESAARPKRISLAMNFNENNPFKVKNFLREKSKWEKSSLSFCEFLDTQKSVEMNLRGRAEFYELAKLEFKEGLQMARLDLTTSAIEKMASRACTSMDIFNQLWLEIYLTDQTLNFNVQINNVDVLKQVQKSGGLIVFSHYGPFFAAMNILKDQGINFNELVDSTLSKSVNSVSEIDAQYGRSMSVSQTNVLQKTLDGVNKGQLIAISGDFSETGASVRHKKIIKFLGHKYRAPIGTSYLVDSLKVPAVSMWSSIVDNKLIINFSRVDGEYENQFFHRLEKLIKKHPDQWVGAHSFSKLVEGDK